MIEFKVIKYTIPLYGNRHLAPYGIVRMTDGNYTRDCHFEMYERFTFHRKGYKIVCACNNSIYTPEFALKEVE